MQQQQETASIRITRDEGKRDLARKPTRRDGSETGCPVVLFSPKGALTHHLRNARQFRRRWYPSLWSGRALCEADAGELRSLRGALDDAGDAPLVRTDVGAVMDSAYRLCRNAAAFPADRHLLLQNPPLAGFANIDIETMKGCDYIWQYTIWRQKS